MTLKEKDNIAKEVAHIFNSGANETRLQCLIERLLIKKEKQHKLQIKEVTKNIKNQVFDLIKNVSSSNTNLIKLDSDIREIQYKEVKPKP